MDNVKYVKNEKHRPIILSIYKKMYITIVGNVNFVYNGGEIIKNNQSRRRRIYNENSSRWIR